MPRYIGRNINERYSYVTFENVICKVDHKLPTSERMLVVDRTFSQMNSNFSIKYKYNNHIENCLENNLLETNSEGKMPVTGVQTCALPILIWIRPIDEDRILINFDKREVEGAYPEKGVKLSGINIEKIENIIREDVNGRIQGEVEFKKSYGYFKILIENERKIDNEWMNEVLSFPYELKKEDLINSIIGELDIKITLATYKKDNPNLSFSICNSANQDNEFLGILYRSIDYKFKDITFTWKDHVMFQVKPEVETSDNVYCTSFKEMNGIFSVKYKRNEIIEDCVENKLLKKFNYKDYSSVKEFNKAILKWRENIISEVFRDLYIEITIRTVDEECVGIYFRKLPRSKFYLKMDNCPGSGKIDYITIDEDDKDEHQVSIFRKLRGYFEVKIRGRKDIERKDIENKWISKTLDMFCNPFELMERINGILGRLHIKITLKTVKDPSLGNPHLLFELNDRRNNIMSFCNKRRKIEKDSLLV